MAQQTSPVTTLTLTSDGLAEGGAVAPMFHLSEAALQNIDLALQHYQSSENELVNVSSDLLALCGTVGRIVETDDLNLVRAEISRSIIDLKYRVVRLDYPPSVAENLCLLFAIVIDEAILSSPWGRSSAWENLTLVADLFGFRDGGDRFYNIAERALMQPKSLQGLLNLIYIFLKLGYRGKYVSGQEKDRDRLIHRLESVLAVEKSQPVPEIYGRSTQKRRPPAQRVSFWRKASIAFVIILTFDVLVVSVGWMEYLRSQASIEALSSNAKKVKPPVYVYSSITETTVIQANE
ncbi:MAG: type IVB secretion system protein IcmH/DotU [Planktomarina sp.]|nr:type IVB secretion system protein IcmH/DotU [Planktomarina sp.]|tara:strand:- start:1698 stop:2573 length:876 start_codon:yes stop_codon:yes gene_type:complete